MSSPRKSPRNNIDSIKALRTEKRHTSAKPVNTCIQPLHSFFTASPGNRHRGHLPPSLGLGFTVVGLLFMTRMTRVCLFVGMQEKFKNVMSEQDFYRVSAVFYLAFF